MRKLAISLLVSMAFAVVTLADGVPVGWTCDGNCGTITTNSSANSSVPLSPAGSYEWISTTNGIDTVGELSSGGTNGSTLTSPVFSASAGSTLNFFFDYVSSDSLLPPPPGTPGDYSWGALYSSSGSLIAVLFKDQTGVVTMANPGATGTVWSPLGTWSGSCAGTGCGNTGWLSDTYTIGASGNYYVEFGVTNVGDEAFDSGLAISGLNTNGQSIGPVPVPEPPTFVLLAMGVMGLAGLAAARHRRIA